MKMEPRKTAQEFRSALVGGTLNSVQMSVVDAKKLRFSAEVSFTPSGSSTATAALIASNNGKPKTYSDVDAAIKDVMAIAPGTGTINLGTIDTTELIKPTPTNPVSAAKSEVRRLVTMLVQFAENKTKANLDLANVSSFQTGSAAQQDIYAEVLAARDAIVAGETAANTRKTALDQFVAANGG
jgi:hypothetical protein